jgi:hypothetical protein
MSDVVLAATDRPVPLVVRRIEDERVPDGLIGIGSYLNESLIARCAVPPDVAGFIEEQNLFLEPVRLVLAATEDEPGLQCRLFALVDVDPDLLGGEQEEREPWADSVPGAGFEPPPDDDPTASSSGEIDAEVEGDETNPAQGMIFLGQIVRFDRDRKHPDSLALEAADVLRRIVDGHTTETIDRVLDDLLGPGGEPPA